MLFNNYFCEYTFFRLVLLFLTKDHPLHRRWVCPYDDHWWRHCKIRICLLLFYHGWGRLYSEGRHQCKNQKYIFGLPVWFSQYQQFLTTYRIKVKIPVKLLNFYTELLIFVRLSPIRNRIYKGIILSFCLNPS